MPLPQTDPQVNTSVPSNSLDEEDHIEEVHTAVPEQPAQQVPKDEKPQEIPQAPAPPKQEPIKLKQVPPKPKADDAVSPLQKQLSQSHLPEDLKIRIENMLKRISAINQSNITQGSYSLQEQEITRKYVEWVLSIPFGVYSQDNLDLPNAKQVMDKNHYGLVDIKERLLEFISSKQLLAKQDAEQSKKIDHPLNRTPTTSPILCFVGVQGIGKTTMAQSIAESLGRKFEPISLSAFASVQEIRGKNKAEPGAEPGQIIKAIIKSGSLNPVILLDEIDKVSSSSGLRADIMAAMLEVLDPAQNHSFMDRYVDYPIDLSQVLFITTANNLSGISAALLDRLEVVRFHSYSDQEKQVIAKQYLLPKVLKQTGVTMDMLEIADETWELVIRPLGFDPGIRQLERNLTSLARKIAKMVVEGQQGKITITPQNFREFFPEQIAVMS